MNLRGIHPTFGKASRGRAVLALGLALLLGLPTWGAQVRAGSLVVYCAQDQVHAEPVFAMFTRETGIRIRPVFDSEAVKTVGLVNRLIREAGRPRCDVFWGNEEFNARRLVRQGVVAGDEWRTFGRRSRQVVINTNLVRASDVPRTLFGLTNAAFRGRVSLAYPLFGTTCTHWLTLRQRWGEAVWSEWCSALMTGRPFVEEGNSHVVRRVGRGEAWIGLTDSDDIAAGLREGLPIAAVDPGADGLVIPNTVALIRGSPNPDNGRRLMDFLTSGRIQACLEEAGAMERSTASAGLAKAPDWDRMLAEFDVGTRRMQAVFHR